MIKVGITGGIGSGKSTVCKVFELLGIPVYYADDEAKKILNDVKVKKELVKIFGKEILNSDNLPDRKKIAELVFNDKKKLEELNAVIHPAVGMHFEEWQKKNEKSVYVIKEAAILFESGAHKQVDKVITVIAPVELKIKRAMHRSNISREEVEQRMNNQLSDDEKIKRSQFIITNDEEQLIIPQVLKIHAELIEKK